MEYTIIYGDSSSTLENNVLDFIAHGWRAQGGVFAVLNPSSNELEWYQALIRG